MSNQNEELKRRIVIKGPRKDRRTKEQKAEERRLIDMRSKIDDMNFEKSLGIFGQLD